MYHLQAESASNSLSKSSSGINLGGLSGSSGGVQPMVLLVVGIIALIVAIVLFVLVVRRKKEFKGKFANWLREYLNFRSILVAGIIKILYIFLAVFLSIMSIITMFQGEGDSVLPMILAGLASLIFGNILLRVGMELTMALIVVWENTSDIRSLLVKKDESLKVEPKKPEIVRPVALKPEPVAPKPEVKQAMEAPKNPTMPPKIQ